MATITQFVDIEAPLDAVWREASDLGSHSEWMADAESIEFETDLRSGVGTVMTVETVVGPLRTTDRMEVTDWVEGESIGVRHSGIVSGLGHFRLSPVAGGTRLVWTEELTFPAYLGGPLTALLAAPILGFVWRRNLRGLKQRIEGGA